MSSSKSSKLSNIMLAIVLILVLMLVAGLVLSVVKGGNDKPDAPIDNVQTNPLDEIKPVENLTSDMWVTGWLIDPAKEPDIENISSVIGDSGDLFVPIDVNTLDTFSRYSDEYRLASFVYQNGCIFNSGNSEVFLRPAYISKMSEGYFEVGKCGWVSGSLFNIQPLSEKVLIDFPFAVRYDCTNYDLIKDFMIPVVDEGLERVLPEPFVANKPIKGFKLKNFDIRTEYGLNDGDVFLEGTVISNPLGVEVGTCSFSIKTFDDKPYICAEFPGIDKRSIFCDRDKNGEYINNVNFVYGVSWINGGNDFIFSDNIVLSFVDTSAYFDNNLWRIIEPIYAEEITDETEAVLLGYNVNLDAFHYVEFDTSMYSFEYVCVTTAGRLDGEPDIIIDPYCVVRFEYNNRNYGMFMLKSTDTLQETMVQLSFGGSIDEFLSGKVIGSNGFLFYEGRETDYGIITLRKSSSNAMFVSWCNANGFEDAVTPIYSQYK